MKHEEQNVCTQKPMKKQKKLMRRFLEGQRQRQKEKEG